MKTKKTSTEKSAKNSGFRSLLPCAKGYRLPSFLTPIFIVLEVTMEVFIPLLMAAIVDGGLYGSAGTKRKTVKSKALRFRRIAPLNTKPLRAKRL